MNMALRKEKKNKIAIKSTKKGGDITVRRPYDFWIDMDRMLDDFRAQFDDLLVPWTQRSEITSYASDRTQPMDIADLGDKYEMHVELPGIPKDDITIEVTPSGVEICAEHEESKEDKEKNWLRRERSSMSYYRSLDLPEEIKSDKVDAEFKNGVLTVMLPKVEPKPKHKPSKVKIK
jgi:HSP20 family protein